MLYCQGAQPEPATEEAWLGEVHRRISKVFLCLCLLAWRSTPTCFKGFSLSLSSGLEKYSDVFQRNEIDFQLFLTMTDKELKEVGSSKPLEKYP